MVLVVGATGLVGGAAVTRLLGQRVPVRALGRTDGAIARLRAVGAEPMRGDLRDRRALEAACRGVSTVVVTANAIRSRRRADSISAVDRDGVLGLIDAAQTAGVTSIVYVSVSPVWRADNPFVRAKRAVEAALSASSLAFTILQPTGFMEVHTGDAAGWHFTAGRARVIGRGLAPARFVSAQDVAAVAAHAAVHDRGERRTLRVGGPEALSAMDAVRVAERVTGRSFRVSHAPAGVLRLVGAIGAPFSPTLPSRMRLLVAPSTVTDVPGVDPALAAMRIRFTRFDEYVRWAVAHGR